MVVSGSSKAEEKYSRFCEFLDAIVRPSRSSPLEIWERVWEEILSV